MIFLRYFHVELKMRKTLNFGIYSTKKINLTKQKKIYKKYLQKCCVLVPGLNSSINVIKRMI